MKLHLAGCIIQNQKGEILLLHRNTAKRMEWELPGGKVELGENAEQAAARELLEELGVKVVIQSNVGEVKFKREADEFLYEWFRALIESETPAVQELSVHDKFGYFALKHMSTLKLSANLQRLYEGIIDGSVKI